jgi:CheY-like chemotaxis protein
MALEQRPEDPEPNVDRAPGTPPSASPSTHVGVPTSRLHGHAALINSLAWPLVFLFLLAIVAAPLRTFLGGVEKFNLEAHGVKLNAEVTKRVASALSGAYDRKEAREGPSAPHGTQAGIEKVVAKVASPESVQRLKGTLLLWVDDHPNNNVLERRALEALGVRFTNVTSNTTAQDVLTFSRYDGIVSDLSRDGDGCDKLTSPRECAKCQALRLLEWMKANPQLDQPGIIFYTSQDKAKLCKAPVLEKGAFGVTGEPGELLDLVTRAVR